MKMNRSKEELIELVEFKSPVREKAKKGNRVALSNSVTSLSTAVSEEENIVNIFSVTPRNRSKDVAASANGSEKRTVSEISDEVFLVKSDSARASSSKNDPRKTYKEKISEHIKKIKEKASTPSSSVGQRTGKGTRAPVERVRRESENVDAEVENVRTRFKLNGKADDKREFFTFVKDHQQVQDDIDEQDYEGKEKIYSYAMPEKMAFNIASSEKECLFVPDRSTLEIDKKIGNAQPIPEENFVQGEIRKIRTGDRNLLEKRLLSGDDRRWFDTSGNLIHLQNPVTSTSYKPTIPTPDHPITAYQTPTTVEDCTEIVVVEHRILDLYLSRLKFTHHPLFTVEHVLAERLRALLQQHRNQEKTVYKLAIQLAELRARRKQQNDGGDCDLGKLDREIGKVREKYFEESGKQRSDLKGILETWRAVKSARESRGYSSTDVKLVIRKEEVDSDAENEASSRMLEDTLRELARERRDEDISRVSEGENGGSSGDGDKSEQDEDSLRRDLIERLGKTLKPPGEPILRFHLSRDHRISAKTDDAKETARRNVASSSKFYLRVVCRNVEACKTKFIGLSEDDFTLDVDETFCLQLTDVPEFLTVEVFEQPKALTKKKVCELRVEIPSGKTGGKLRTVEFEKNEIVHYKHAGVGSGVELKTLLEKANLTLTNIPSLELRTSGYLEYSIEWEKPPKREEESAVLPSKFDILNEIIDKNCRVGENKFREFMESSNFEECSLPAEEYATSENNKGFRLNPYQKPLNFCNITEIEQNIRLKILCLRNQKEIEFDGMLVPNRIKEIPFSVLSDYRRRKAIEEKAESFEDDFEDNVEAQRSSGRKYLRSVYLRTFQLCKNTENNLDYESVVDEKYLINFHLMVRTLLGNFLNWFRWRPKISKPLPVRAKKAEDDEREGVSRTKSNARISVKVVSGKNIPNRLKTTFNEDDAVENDVRPFVRITYKNLTARTSTGQGTNPSWDEILTVPLEAANTDYLNPNSLDGSIVVDLFDDSEIEIKKLNKKCVNWLGGVDISISAICCSDSMNGFFRVKLPHVLLGYETEEEKQRTKSPKIGALPHCFGTYLQMEISVEPNVPKLNPNMQLINLMLGSVTDHAIALTCFLLALKMEAWLLLGYGIPHGSTAYVLVREHNTNTGIPSYHIFDVVHNEKYNILDEYCPLQKIFCVINGSNVWGNIQKTDTMSLTRFDLSRRSDWSPLFNDDLPSPTNFISNKVTYRESHDTEMIEMHLERQLKRQISKLRQLDRTVWNTGLSSLLANTLKSFESNAMYSRNHFEAAMDLVKDISPYTVRGYALNIPFTSISNIVKKIKGLGIHVQQENNIEFATAVHIHSYPGLLLSVWLFVVNIES